MRSIIVSALTLLATQTLGLSLEAKVNTLATLNYERDDPHKELAELAALDDSMLADLKAYDAAKAATRAGGPLLVMFTAKWCNPC